MIEQLELARDLKICRILNGMWQVSGSFGYAEPTKVIQDMINYHNAGFTTWDLADIYGSSELFIGKFRKSLESQKGKLELQNSQALTKFVPSPGIMTKNIVTHHINSSLEKMKTDCLDLVQFHWWDYNDPNYFDALIHLSNLREEGKIKHVGLTNFDTERLEQIKEHGIKFVLNQIQYSILDSRPNELMIPFCLKNNIHILAYGTLLGGFLSEKYLGMPEPTRTILNTPSLQKYYKMIQVWGGWKLFQELLDILSKISKKHACSIANVATSFILEKPPVAGVIIGTRLGLAEHRDDNFKVFEFHLDSEDRSLIDSVTKKSQNLFALIGDCGSEYR